MEKIAIDRLNISHYQSLDQSIKKKKSLSCPKQDKRKIEENKTQNTDFCFS